MADVIAVAVERSPTSCQGLAIRVTEKAAGCDVSKKESCKLFFSVVRVHVSTSPVCQYRNATITMVHLFFFAFDKPFNNLQALSKEAKTSEAKMCGMSSTIK